MNGNSITNAGPAVSSNDLMTLGQLPSHHYLYGFTSSDIPITNQPYIDLVLSDLIQPYTLTPQITARIQ